MTNALANAARNVYRRPPLPPLPPPLPLLMPLVFRAKPAVRNRVTHVRMMGELLMSEGFDDAGDAGKLSMPHVTGAQGNKSAAAFAMASHSQP
jgi:hypothetical protein